MCTKIFINHNNKLNKKTKCNLIKVMLDQTSFQITVSFVTKLSYLCLYN